ncbi:MAG: hypothetical protein ACYDA1_01710 [Vulcanimicrobiaceae bacterium]
MNTIDIKNLTQVTWDGPTETLRNFPPILSSSQGMLTTTNSSPLESQSMPEQIEVADKSTTTPPVPVEKRPSLFHRFGQIFRRRGKVKPTVIDSPSSTLKQGEDVVATPLPAQDNDAQKPENGASNGTSYEAQPPPSPQRTGIDSFFASMKGAQVATANPDPSDLTSIQPPTDTTTPRTWLSRLHITTPIPEDRRRILMRAQVALRKGDALRDFLGTVISSDPELEEEAKANLAALD